MTHVHDRQEECRRDERPGGADQSAREPFQISGRCNLQLRRFLLSDGGRRLRLAGFGLALQLSRFQKLCAGLQPCGRRCSARNRIGATSRPQVQQACVGRGRPVASSQMGKVTGGSS